jgi:hypothetical protein
MAERRRGIAVMYEDSTVLLGEIPILRTGIGKLNQLLGNLFYRLLPPLLKEGNVVFCKSEHLNQEFADELDHLREMQLFYPLSECDIVDAVLILAQENPQFRQLTDRHSFIEKMAYDADEDKQ